MGFLFSMIIELFTCGMCTLMKYLFCCWAWFWSRFIFQLVLVEQFGKICCRSCVPVSDFSARFSQQHRTVAFAAYLQINNLRLSSDYQ